MKKVLIFSLLVVLAVPAMTQGRKYNKTMLSAVKEMNDANDPAGQMKCVADFESIAQKYPDQWLPPYHASRILVISCFSEPDTEKKEALLNRSKTSLDRALEIAPEESEVQVVKALYYIGMISADAESRGPIYYQEVLDAIEKSKSLNPENPRAWYLDGLMTLNMPAFLGGGPEAAKPILLEAQKKFKSYTRDDPFWPSWGEDLNQSELDRLK